MVRFGSYRLAAVAACLLLTACGSANRAFVDFVGDDGGDLSDGSGSGDVNVHPEAGDASNDHSTDVSLDHVAEAGDAGDAEGGGDQDADASDEGNDGASDDGNDGAVVDAGPDVNCIGQTSCGVGACKRVVENCDDAGVPQTCVPGDPVAETCNGLDDDCNGTDDDNLGQTQCGIGQCSVTVDNCVNGQPQACVPLPAGVETCNGLDDDCNGTADDNLGTTQCGQGECSRTVDNCVNGLAQACVPGDPVAETCNGLDDDCDGVDDNGLGTVVCGSGSCIKTVPSCVNGQPQSCVPGQPATEVCNNIDDNCDGQIDNGDPADLCPFTTNATGSACLQGGVCQISSCAAGAFDVDGDYTDGCECVDDTSGSSCANATSLGAVTPGTSTSSSGTIPLDGMSDWYAISFPTAGTGTPTISFQTNQDALFRFEVHPTCPAAPVACGNGGTATGITTWAFNDNCGGAPNCTTRSVAWPSTVFVRVYRPVAGKSCNNYTLAVSR